MSHVPVEDGQERNLKRNFTMWTALGIALCASGAWEGWIASIAQGLLGGGPVALFWGWIFVAVGIACEACSLAEMASAWPSAGGQYVWAAELAPPSMKRIISWYTFWISFAGLWIGAVSSGMGVAVQLQSYVAVTREYDMTRWHAFLICMVCFVIWVVVNIVGLRAVHLLNDTFMYIHVAGLIAVIATLLACTKDKHDAHYVFLEFDNLTGYSSNGVAWCIGLLPSLYAFFSLDTATHYSEEVKDANKAVPRAIMIQACLNGIMTLPFIIVVLFCIGDVESVLGSQIGFTSPFTQVILNSTGSPAAAVILNLVSTYIAFGAGLDLWGAAARALWSIARDGALPQAFARVHPKYAVPVWPIVALLPPSIILTMIYIWNSTAFYGIMSGVLVSFQLSYAIPIALRVFYGRWRVKTMGPWTVGRVGIFIDIYALCFCIFMIIFMSFPSTKPITATNMNYSVVIVGGVFVFATCVWFLYARKRYQDSPLVHVGEAQTASFPMVDPTFTRGGTHSSPSEKEYVGEERKEMA
ncbi:hypothetical protein LTR10_020453 [Elasticomyces elasticus]|uniref:Amino acid permease/ SLC12A domain-containing protein n=1 Tax=Exophiala sideris TaxID=1016849 RepID=A0ABR0J3P5_9EURO|nr:hypothetical protein LTR10_020453 [Elasticomyces elasticus]KAK5027023.1 hypothetical protein LTS07_007322 [Exophiala sideris]KAK5034027.1 hypothetical protein LTR13_006627 [Exophiala sideris]KAK5055698.1 hypothetical protein LTR69_008073 [Exophiala sideris]KAK5180969.1 hypothetical protein LTR44_006789 [Eurotiomycetes sp. CCFEE 6388]